MLSYTIDTNVLIVANNKNQNVTPKQIIKVIDFIQKIIQDKQIVSIDSLGLILEEYRRYLNFKGAPGVGDKFYKWIHDNLGSNLCEQVQITPGVNEFFVFRELFKYKSLEGFDKSDQKFVAVALKSAYRCRICNAVDTDWDNYELALKEIGIKVINVAN